MKNVYIARLKEDRPQLIKSVFAQETKRAIYVQHGENEIILGDKPWFTSRVNKRDSSRGFPSKQDALKWLEEELVATLERYKRRIGEVDKYLQDIRARLDDNE